MRRLLWSENVQFPAIIWFFSANYYPAASNVDMFETVQLRTELYKL